KQPWSLQLSFSALDGPQTTISAGGAFDYTHPDAGPDGKLVFQRNADDGNGNPTGTPEVWFYDPAAGSDPSSRASLITGNASAPALSPDATHVAFVRSDGSHNQIWISDLLGGNLVQVTSNAVEHNNPTWSPDGLTIAFNNNGTAVYKAPADGSGAASPTA